MKRRHLIVIALSLLFAPIYQNLACEVAGDIDCDGKIDHEDVMTLCDQWLQTPAESEPNADLNLDGKIDFTDFSIMAGDWGGDGNWPGEKSEPEPNWVVYPGYEAAVGYPMCSYDGNIICRGYYDTGIHLFNGTSYSYGAKPNYNSIQQAWGLTRSFDIGLLLQTVHGTTPELEYAALPYSGYFTVVSPSRFSSDPDAYITQLHRSAVDCGEINDIDIGVIAQWKFDEESETSGPDSIADSSGNNNHLTPSSPIVIVNSANPATMNTAIDFDGNNQYMRVAGSGLEPTGDFTICFWMKLNDISEGGKTIIVQGTSGGRCIEAQGSKLRVFLDHDGATDACALTDDGYLSAAEWDFYSIVYTAADDNISFYKNGNNSSIWNITPGSGTLVNYGSSDFYIGGSPDGNLMNGQLDNVMVFNRALTGNQIKILYSGRPDGSGAGTQDLNRLRRVVLYFEYGGPNCNAWFSRDDCLTWTRMWDANATGIIHFHGGIFEPNVGDKGRLYVFTGDYPPEPSILTCDDINDLLTNRETWYGRWGLGAGQRTNWTPDSNYVLGWNDEKWRITDMVSDGIYGYWMPDNSAVWDIAVYKVRHSDKTVTTLATCPQVKGGGWIGLYTSKGDVIYSSITSIASNHTFDSCGVDEWIRLYQIKKDDSVVELNKWRISVYNPFVNPVIAPSRVVAAFYWLSELNGIIYMYGQNIEPYDLSSLGSLNYPRLTKAGSIGHAYPDFNITPMINPIINGTFDNGFNYWTKGGSGWSIDSEVTEGGHPHSAKCVDVFGTPYLKQYIWADDLPIGSYVTVKVKIRVASGADYGFTPAIILGINDGGAESTQFSLANSSSTTALADNSWHEFWAPAFIRPGTWYLGVYLFPNYGWGHGTIYMSDVRIESGRAFGYEHF
jgi:hypothetical protein